MNPDSTIRRNENEKNAPLISILAAVALFAQPAFADDAHRHEECAHAAQKGTAEPAKKMNVPESTMQESMEKMRTQMAEINQAKDSKKRRKLLQEHNKSMRDSVKMMREMMGGMAMGYTMGGDHKMCDHKMGDHKMCDHMMGGNPVSQPGSNADADPAAQANPGQVTPTGKASSTRGGKLWICPMHPDVARGQPGVCPICGMDLVEVEQSGASQAGHSHTGGCMKGDCMGEGGMKNDCMKSGSMKRQMMGITDKHMSMMLMEQMIEHNETEMAARK